MKVVEVTELAAASYDDIVFHESKKANKFGKMFYANERICLVIRKPISDYGLWSSANDEVHLTFTLSVELKRQFDSIIQAATHQLHLDFKEYGVGEKLFIKIHKDVGAVSLNNELRIVIGVYAVFHQSATQKAFLQLEVKEIDAKKFSLLPPSLPVDLHYSPSSIFFN